MTRNDIEEGDCRSYEEVRLQKLEERQADMIHVADLRELLEEWRGWADAEPNPAASWARNRCADDLEEMIEDE